MWRRVRDFFNGQEPDALAAIAPPEEVFPFAHSGPAAGFAPRFHEITFQAANLPAGHIVFRIFPFRCGCGIDLHASSTFALFPTRWRAFFAGILGACALK